MFNFLKRKKSTDLISYKSEHTSLIGRHKLNDWFVILGIFLMLNIVIIGFNIYIYSGVVNGALFQAEKTNPFFFDKAELKKTIDYYNEKAKRFEEIKSNPPIFVDPAH